MPSAAEVMGLKELKSQNLYRSLAAECIGTLLLNFFGVISCVALAEQKKSSFVEVSLAFGFAVFVAVQAFGHVSGGHVNPAVTVSMIATGRTPVIRGVFYIVAQCVGAIAGTGIVKAVTPDKHQGLLGTTLANAEKSITAGQALGVEILLGFVLVLTVFAVCDPHRPECKPIAPLAIGLSVALGHLATIDFTGSSMNPARSLGSVVFSGDYTHCWVFWLGPITGGIAAGLLYTYVFSAPASPQALYTVVSTTDREGKSLRLTRMEDNRA